VKRALKSGVSTFLAFCFSVGLILNISLVLAAGSLAVANADLQAGKADEAASLLKQALQSDPNDAEANNLLCRVEYATQHFDQAAGHCEKAVSLSQQNARYHLWLARVIGERASRAAFMSAFSLAKKSREQFEDAVKFDPRDAEALSDLGEFYKEAPGVVGGGMDKAEEIAKKLDAVDVSRAHQLRAEMAEKQKDLVTAERELKAACTGSRAAAQWMQLASFYRRQERWPEMEAAVKSGEAAAAHDRHAAAAFFNGGSVLARANRQPQEAIKLYERYIDSADKTEEAPAFDVLTRLAKLRMQTGDQAGAQRDRAAALALAHDYKPAQELKS
jgi:tetratricopeptide (TPR) repeat protein